MESSLFNLFPFNTVGFSVVHIANPNPLNTPVFNRYSQNQGKHHTTTMVQKIIKQLKNAAAINASAHSIIFLVHQL
jgi:hypothetical protein